MNTEHTVVKIICSTGYCISLVITRVESKNLPKWQLQKISGSIIEDSDPITMNDINNTMLLR